MDPLSVGMTATTAASLAVAAACCVRAQTWKLLAKAAGRDLAAEKKITSDRDVEIVAKQAAIDFLNGELASTQTSLRAVRDELFRQKLAPDIAARVPEPHPKPSWHRERDAKGHFIKAATTA